MKITMPTSTTARETFDDFLLYCKAKGLAEKTLATYKQHISAIGKHIELSVPIEEIVKSHIEKMLVSMRDAGLASKSIQSYTRTLRTFFGWCREEGLSNVHVPLYKAEETVKETYTDDELRVLLQKPNIRKCRFTEYRDWVEINLLVNNGIRAASVRNIQIQDVDLDNRVIALRHTKSKKVQIIPLCDLMCGILREYLRIRGGGSEDYLFPNETGGQLTENGLRCSIAHYNKRRGVEKTSIHLFRHTFARKYLVDCGGNALTLQKLLGHATLEMTKHYCAIFDADIAKDFDKFSPLAQISASGKRITMGKRAP